MSNKVKDIDLKNWTYYFFNDIIYIKKYQNNIEIDKNSNKNILIYNVGYVTFKDSKHIKNNSANPLHLIFSKVNGYFGESNKKKYLTLAFTNERKGK